MGSNAISFLLGLGAAWLAPTLARVLRPLAVEATAAGMGLLQDARRIAAEQLETIEDIAAEARARREAILAATNGNGHVDVADEESVDAEADETAAPPRPRRAAERRRARSTMPSDATHETLEVVHHIPGRLRVRIPQSVESAGLTDAVSALPGVTSVAYSSLTRRLLVLYDRERADEAAIVSAIADRADLDV